MVYKQYVKLFRRAANKIPAYKAYLADHDFAVNKVRTIEDFTKIPVTTKKTYLQTHDRSDLVWPASFKQPVLFCATSGSTGEPYYFPRNEKLSWQMSQLVEDFVNNSSYGKGRTLVIIGFGMGVWIGGIITLRAFEIAAERVDSQLAILPAGYNKKEIFKALKKLAPEYDQTILIGYPPFTKEVIDEAEEEGIDLKSLNLRLMFAAESFTETFRNYVSEKGGVQSPILDTLNIYGTADIGAMAHETPISILIRRLAIEDPLLYRDLFGQIAKTPTLAQYNPEFIQFEEVDGDIVLTSDGALPLIRYAVGDHGGIMQYTEIAQKFRHYGINLDAEIKKAGIKKPKKNWPFVYVYERADFASTLHGIIIYPEFIKEGLVSKSVSNFFTERFTMSTKTDVHHNQFLQVNLELQKGVEPSDELQQLAFKRIQKSMKQKSSEFAEVSKSKSSDDLLQIVLWPNGHPRYFAPGTKQRWVEK